MGKLANVKKFLDFTGKDKAKITHERMFLPDEKTGTINFAKCPEIIYDSDKKRWQDAQVQP